MMNQTFNRHRRLRANAAMRDLVKETRLHPSDFIYPLFVVEGLEGKKRSSFHAGGLSCITRFVKG